MEQESEADRVQLEDMMKTGDSAAVSDKLVKNMLVHSAVKCLLRGEKVFFFLQARRDL